MTCSLSCRWALWIRFSFESNYYYYCWCYLGCNRWKRMCSTDSLSINILFWFRLYQNLIMPHELTQWAMNFTHRIQSTHWRCHLYSPEARTCILYIVRQSCWNEQTCNCFCWTTQPLKYSRCEQRTAVYYEKWRHWHWHGWTLANGWSVTQIYILILF